MREMNDVFKAGLSHATHDLIFGQGMAGKPGPVRVGKPPIDVFGDLIIESARGDYGPLPNECEWIENHDEVFIEYAGEDENWPTGCWVIQSSGDDQFVDAEQLKYIAHELLGMPESVKSRTRNTRVGPARTEVVVLGNKGRDYTNTLMMQTDGQRAHQAAIELDLEDVFDDKPTIVALAKVGINALIDEATGYEDDRGKDDLAQMFADYMEEEDPDPTDEWWVANDLANAQDDLAELFG
jgi:hypothetical protein